MWDSVYINISGLLIGGWYDKKLDEPTDSYHRPSFIYYLLYFFYQGSSRSLYYL